MEGMPYSSRGADGEVGIEGIPADVARRLVRSLDRTPGAIVVLVDSDLRIRWLSRSASWVTGSDPDERRGTDSLDRIHPDDVDRLVHGLAQLKGAAEAGGSMEPLVAGPFRYRFRRFDNDQWVVMEAHVHNLLDDPVADGMLVISRPVSGALDGVGHVIDLLVADAPLSDVLAACCGLVPSHVGSAAVIGLLGASTVIGVHAGSPAEELVTDERWWRATLEDGELRVPVEFAGFPEDLAARARSEGFLSAWVSPLFDGSSRDIIGALVVWVCLPGERNIIGDEALRPAERLASLVIGEQRRHHALRRAAATDPLTGIGNRAALHRRLDGANGPVTLAIIDLDDFKPINDIHGHDTGDAVLQIVAQRLMGSVRDGDLVARYGGDEFAVVFADTTSTDGLALRAQRLIDAIRAPIKLPNGPTVTIGASIGVASDLPDQVIKAADAELYRAKQAKHPSTPSSWS